MSKKHMILSEVLETPIYIPDNHENLILSLEEAFECSLPDSISKNTIGVVPDGIIRQSSLYDIFYGRDGTNKAIAKGSFQEASAFLPDNIVEMGLLNYKAVLSHFQVAREERLSNGYYETMTPDTSRKIFKRATSEKQMAQFFDVFSEYATECLHENHYIPVDDFPTRPPQNKTQPIFYIALPGKDNTCFCDIAALNSHGEVVGMVTGGNRYVVPEYRGQNIGVEMVLIDELFPGLKAMSQTGEEHSYTPGGLKSREKAIRHIQNSLDVICPNPKPIYTLSP